jgi:hypothetical protein
MKSRKHPGTNYRKASGEHEHAHPLAKARAYFRLKTWPFLWSCVAAVGSILYVSVGQNPNALYVLPVIVSGCLLYVTHGWVEQLKHPRVRVSRTYASVSEVFNEPLPSPVLAASLPPKSTNRTLAAITSNTTLTPAEIRDKINRADPLKRKEASLLYIDTPVRWTLLLLSADPSSDNEDMLLCFKTPDSDPSSPVLVLLQIPLTGNEYLSLSERNDRFQVSGSIKEINNMGNIVLKDASLERVPAAK